MLMQRCRQLFSPVLEEGPCFHCCFLDHFAACLPEFHVHRELLFRVQLSTDSSWACFHLRVTCQCKSRLVLEQFSSLFRWWMSEIPLFFFLPGVHNPLLLSDDFNPALPRQSSVVIWELPCASHDKSHQEFLAFERCRWGKVFNHGLGPGGHPLSCDSPGTAMALLRVPSLTHQAGKHLD